VTRERIAELLQRFRSGEIGEEEALEQLARGLPEVVLGLGKSADQITRIVRELRAAGANVLVTRVEPEVARAVRDEIPDLTHHPTARALTLRQSPSSPVGRGSIVVITAGTSDVPVAEEAALTAELFGNKVERLYDVGVAGLHRLLASLDVLRSAQVAIVAAGMEGALPSVVGGLIDRPVIAVPTSVGYGASLGGIAALLAMLNACSPNVTTVNIDNGFGAAFVASLINRG
jgi:NCAIR mutase (PurE)-related protein